MSPLPIMVKRRTVTASLAEVWHAWTTAEGLEFISNKSNVALRVGGPYEWFLDLEPDENGKRGGQGAQILAWLPQRMLAFTWTLPPAVPTLRNADETFQVVVFFQAVDDTNVSVELHAHGWGEGPDWQAGWNYFDIAWDKVLDAMTF